MLMLSKDIGSRPFGVIFTARRAVFICGDTAVIVPCRIVPKNVNGRIGVKSEWGSFTIFELYRHRLVCAFHEEPRLKIGVSLTAMSRILGQQARLCTAVGKDESLT